jgi:uncharacterized protein YycO
MMYYDAMYRAGDILTACDNELNVPTGYLGHSAIVIDNEHIIEAVVTFPYVQVGKIADFVRVHPKHAHYRPNSQPMGESAAQYAVAYFQQSMKNYEQGYIIPPFSFSQYIPLEDAWSSIYCSKLIWLSYYYGTGYSFYNDFFLFTPEDLDTVLQTDHNFKLLYKHPEFIFLVNS